MQLTEEEKLEAIACVRNEIAGLPFTDILIVGGEVYCPHSEEVNQALADLFRYIRNRIDLGMTRLFYANTNMIYADRTVLKSLLDTFIGAEDKLRLTTSYDIYGRYATEENRQMFLSTLGWVAQNYPNMQTVVNCILTKQMCEYITSGSFHIREFYSQNNLAFINFIPYIAIDKTDDMFPTWNEVTEALLYVESVEPHYLRYYCDQLDFMQDRVLKEYHKDEGFVVCTSEYLPCEHNSNYTRATADGDCFVCKMKRTIAFEMRSENFDTVIQKHIADGGKIATIGDVCSEYVWTRYRCPDWIIYDGYSQEDADVTSLIRQNGVTRLIASNEGQFLSEDLDATICKALARDCPVAIFVIGEEDAAVFSVMRHMPDGTMVIVGDPHDKCIKYTIISKTNTETPETSYEVIYPSLNPENQV